MSAGRAAVAAALAGTTDQMIGFVRSAENGKYICRTATFLLSAVANAEKTVPDEWINKAGNGVTQAFIDYALPLIQGEPSREMEKSLPCFAHLKRIPVSGGERE